MYSAFKQKQLQHMASSVITLYRAWDQSKIPAIIYHYILSILTKKQKKEQINIINKEIKMIQKGVHPFHLISDLIQAREQSLQIIHNTIEALEMKQYNQLEWQQDVQQDFQKDYRIVYKSKNNRKHGDRKLIELINHVKIYRKVTLQVINRIDEWMMDLENLGYESIIQFLYKHQDYLEKIVHDTQKIISYGQNMFQKNPFLLLKKDLMKTEYALIYEYLKISSDQIGKIEKALTVLADHHANIQKTRLLGGFRQIGSRKKLAKVNKFQQIYCKFNKNGIVVRSDQMGGTKYKSWRTHNFVINPQINREEEIPLKRNMIQIRDILPHGRKQHLLERSFSLGSLHSASKDIGAIEQVPQKQQILNIHDEQCKLLFEYQKNLLPVDIFNYLKRSVFKDMSISFDQLQARTKKYLSLRDSLSFITIKSQNLIVAWLAVTFHMKTQMFRKTVDIMDFQKFMKVPDLQEALMHQFVSKGYGIVREKGKIVHEQYVKQDMNHNNIQIDIKVNASKRDEIKKMMKNDKKLKCSRILKYYTYSQDTKYHRFCFHREVGCQLLFNFQQIVKISLSGRIYFKAKCDKIYKQGQLWIIQHHLNNNILVFSQNFKQIVNFQDKFNKSSNIEKDKSQIQEKVNTQNVPILEYLCIPQFKIMNKYVNNNREQLMVECLVINSDCLEPLSIARYKKDLNNCLILDKSYYLGIVCSDAQDYGKPLMIIQLK